MRYGLMSGMALIMQAATTAECHQVFATGCHKMCRGDLPMW